MIVLVTGASRGIGRGIATVLARHGHKVGLAARSEEGLREVRDELRAAGGVCEAVACDVCDAAATEAALGRLIERLGGVDALVNNAGVVIRKDVLALSLDEWRQTMATNVDGVFHATRAVLPRLKAQGRGHIVNISSISGRVPLPGGSAYAASKYAVTGFSESLFEEVRGFGVKVTIVFPGSVDSASHRADAVAPEAWKVTPEEVGEAVRGALETSATNCISRLEIRPLRKPQR